MCACCAARSCAARSCAARLASVWHCTQQHCTRMQRVQHCYATQSRAFWYGMAWIGYRHGKALHIFRDLKRLGLVDWLSGRCCSERCHRHDAQQCLSHHRAVECRNLRTRAGVSMHAIKLRPSVAGRRVGKTSSKHMPAIALLARAVVCSYSYFKQTARAIGNGRHAMVMPFISNTAASCSHAQFNLTIMSSSLPCISDRAGCK